MMADGSVIIGAISIPAPLTGRDVEQGINNITKAVISIPAPLTGRDSMDYHALSVSAYYFNPRAPCGARLSLYVLGLYFHNISILAPLAGRDSERERKC